MYNLITIGDAVIDTHVLIDNASVECDLRHEHCKLCMDYAGKIPVTDSFQSLGGNAANVAVGAAKLGLSAAVMTSVGKDSNGQFLRQELKKFNVDTRLMNVDPKVKTRYSIILNYKGERTVLSYHEKRKYYWPKAVLPTEWIYYTSLSRGFEDFQAKLFKFLEKHPTVRLAINPGSFQIKYALNEAREAVKRADLLIVNMEEAEAIAGATLAQEKSVSAIIHKLLQMGAKEVAITDAGRGAWAGNYEEIWHLDSFPVEVVAKTGAGDAFSSGYVAAKINGHYIPTALSWGVANSCGVIEKIGAQAGLLDKKGVKKMINKFAVIKPTIISSFSTQTQI